MSSAWRATVAGRAMPAPMAAEMKSLARQKEEGEVEDRAVGGGVLGGVPVDIAGIRVRSDFREVLFFKNIETDANGNAEVEFESSDQLSTFRIMAVAYSEDSFGSAEKKIVVSKDLLISEAMPEFARQGDEFIAGVQLSNRTMQKLPVTLLAKPEGISINGNPQIERVLDARGNSLFQFPFLADRIGEAKIDFYAVSTADKDGLQKKLPVTDRLVTETLIDFASGKFLKKMIEPQAEAENQVITIKAAPSLLRPAVNIAKKLVFYPYECMEQRASKVMPFLAFSPQLAERLELGLDQGQIREAVNGYLKIIPEFMNSQGALSYYRGGQYSSDYLTAYVLWSLHLARERDYMVDPQLVQKLSAYLQRASLDRTCESFYQFVLSLNKGADSKKLKKLAAERDTLPLPARVFLYRALNNQGKPADLLAAMLAEFNSSLQVEADFAYFDAGEFAYHRDFPFYSSRFATALLLQAVLEVDGGHVLAERIIRWLLEAEPYCWNTTQTNFWVLCAMDQYLAKVEKTTARKAEIVLLGEKAAKEFTNYQDMLSVSKKLEGRKEPVEASVTADQPVYVTSELTYQLARAGKKSRGIDIQRLVYNEKGQAVDRFKRGQIYQVELLIKDRQGGPLRRHRRAPGRRLRAPAPGHRQHPFIERIQHDEPGQIPDAMDAPGERRRPPGLLYLFHAGQPAHSLFHQGHVQRPLHLDADHRPGHVPPAIFRQKRDENRRGERVAEEKGRPLNARQPRLHPGKRSLIFRKIPGRACDPWSRPAGRRSRRPGQRAGQRPDAAARRWPRPGRCRSRPGFRCL